ARTGRRLLIWLVQSVVLVLGFGLAVYFVPSLFLWCCCCRFFPVVMGMLAWVGAFYDDPWTYGVASALFFGWLLAAVFPLV
ncbi:MAG: alpha/beta hydrolase, partial [Synechococcales cyanobacterium CRU_2_2]|nr:alpha/beta hydrolase [Synechococcales cyanobacterium CRU_2_2]